MNLKKYQNISLRDYEAVAGPDWPSYTEFQLHNCVESYVYDEIDAMLAGPRILHNPAFCVLPFYGIELQNSQNTVCCLLPNNYDLDKIKSDMLSGQRPSACQKCWNLEDRGIKSDRQIKNETLDFYFDKDLHTLFDQCKEGKNFRAHYKIDSSNTCNSTCITCNSESSSLWGQLETRNGVTAKKNWTLQLDSFSNSIDFKSAKSIGFRGGEPLLSATNFEILENLIKHGNNDCFINFTTNGGVRLNQRQKDILSEFSNVNMCFSIDGTGPVFEYLRHPLRWELLVENIDHCRSNGIGISSSYTLSNLNILYHDVTTAWFDQNQIRYLVNPVYSPSHFRPSALPIEVKSCVLQTLKDSGISNLLINHSDQDEQDYKIFQQEIAKQDHWKNIKMHNYLPELCDLLG